MKDYNTNLIVNEISQEHIVLVDENDNEVGIAEKMAAHREARLHRAFSIFILILKEN